MQEIPILGRPQPKQREFMLARAKYVAFGGARGGGKSWAVREKAKRLAIRYGGIRILILRRTLVDLRENHILPLRASLPESVAVWHEADKSFLFANGSRIRCSYFDAENDALMYQGQEYDVIFLEEATQFPETVFQVLKACLRGVNDFPKRLYLTCNPDGIGFFWVKRLFIDREYRRGEKPEDYLFIQSLADDNAALLRSDPDYLAQLDSLPDDMRARWRYGLWDVPAGQYFSEFNESVHRCEPFTIPPEWRRYRTIDYGLDRLACYWIAVSPERKCFVYRELCESDLPIGEAAAKILAATPEDETIYLTLAPPDLWGRSQETGRSKEVIFHENGLALTKSDNNREAGWLAVKELLRTDRDGNAGLAIFRTCPELLSCLPALLRDPSHPSDTRTEPHEITHAPDALRYFAVWWFKPAPVSHLVPTLREDLRQDWLRADAGGRRYLAEKYGMKTPEKRYSGAYSKGEQS